MVKVDTVLARVYIEGVLFPFVKTIQISESQGGVSCQLEVPPSSELKPEEWKGAMCHIFYANARVLELFGGSMYGPPFELGWPIIFQGELSGFQESNGVQSETIMLQFVSHKRHFDQTLLYFYDPLNKSTNSSIAAHNEAWFIGNTTINLDTNGVLSRQNQMLSILNQRMEDVLESGGDGRNIAFSSLALEVLRSARTQHALFGYFDNKLKLSSRFAAYADPDVQNILKLTTFKNLMDSQVSRMPPYSSLMDSLEIMTNMMHYNWMHFSQPKLREGVEDPSEERFGVTIKEVQELIIEVTKELTRGETSTKLGTFTFGEVSDTSFISPQEFADKVFENMYFAIGSASDINVLTRNSFIVILKEFTPISKKSVSDFTKIVLNLDAQKVEKDSKKALFADQKNLEIRDELNEFTILPNMEFSHPPKCNVFLPSTMSNYGISRDHLQELTRLFARVQLSPAQSGGEYLIEWYIAPIAQSYHLIQDNYLNDFSDEYIRFMNRNEVVEDE